jgi:prepilin signal peptidase PulO-like enzyme (type II secretory pathway)
VNSALVAAVWLLAGAAVGFGIRRLSVWLARHEELEPGSERWQVWGPVVTTAVLFAAFGWRLGATPLLLITSLWVALLVQVIFFDIEHRLILDRLMFPSYPIALLLSIFTPHLGWKQSAIAGVAAGAVFLTLAVLGRLAFRAEVLGIGDVKLAVFIGLVLGFQGTISALLLGVLLAGAVSIFLIAIRVKGLKDTIAYGPYLCAGALVGLFQQG